MIILEKRRYRRSRQAIPEAAPYRGIVLLGIVKRNALYLDPSPAEQSVKRDDAGISHRDQAARNAEGDDAGFCQLHSAGGPSSVGLAGADFTFGFGFFVFRATPTATATGTAAQKAYFSFFLRGIGRFEGTTAASCERSIGLPIFISVRSYANCLPQSRHTTYAPPSETPWRLTGENGRVKRG